MAASKTTRQPVTLAGFCKTHGFERSKDGWLDRDNVRVCIGDTCKSVIVFKGRPGYTAFTYAIDMTAMPESVAVGVLRQVWLGRYATV